jgi:hypothetical protein
MNAKLIPALLLFLLIAMPCRAAAEQPAPASLPTVTFTKEFPGSNPDYYSIALRQDGSAFYRTAPDEKPTAFQVSENSAAEVFALAEKLHHFHETVLESKRKVANMGKKTFLYENGQDRGEVSYNHTEDADALALADLFERLANTEQHRDRIEYLRRFDRLGMVKELLQLEIDLDQGRLLEPGLLLPLLEKVQTDQELVNVAHERAAGIIAKLEATKK